MPILTVHFSCVNNFIFHWSHGISIVIIHDLHEHVSYGYFILIIADILRHDQKWIYLLLIFPTSPPIIIPP